ncbi:MAG TPA: hypothetical protein VIN40_03590 [Candidatus Tyrphobacter sp.]
MNKRGRVIRAFFRGLARVQQTFEIQIGPIHARGVPAILIGVTGIVVASGVTAMLAKSAERLPETLREARGLTDSIRGTRAPLNP